MLNNDLAATRSNQDFTGNNSEIEEDDDFERMSQKANNFQEIVFQIQLTPQEYQMIMQEKQRRGIAF